MMNYCNNCGKYGHLQKTCNEPITSYGIIAFYKDQNDSVRFLNINRKQSIAFLEFVRGKYIYMKSGKFILNTEYIFVLFKNMTKSECELIKVETFDNLWKRWISNRHPKYNSEFDHAKKKYEAFKHGIKVKQNFYSIDTVMNKTYTINEEPEWGFPKGRKNYKENALTCALREFEEETDLSSTKLKVVHKHPLYEDYIGFNNVMYRNVYYIAEFHSPDINDYINIKVNHNNIHQRMEIGKIAWMTSDDACSKYRDYHSERGKVLRQALNIINHQYYNKITDPFDMPVIQHHLQYVHNPFNIKDIVYVKQYLPLINMM